MANLRGGFAEPWTDPIPSNPCGVVSWMFSASGGCSLGADLSKFCDACSFLFPPLHVPLHLCVDVNRCRGRSRFDLRFVRPVHPQESRTNYFMWELQARSDTPWPPSQWSRSNLIQQRRESERIVDSKSGKRLQSSGLGRKWPRQPSAPTGHLLTSFHKNNRPLLVWSMPQKTEKQKQRGSFGRCL